MISDSGWRKSTRSGANGACVETRLYSGGAQVRDSKLDPEAPMLAMATSDLTALLATAAR